MESEPDERTSTKTYELTCATCSFEATVEGDFLDALDVADAHQEEYGVIPTEHLVNIELGGYG